MYSVLVVLWQIVIFCFSAQNADMSSNLSGGLTQKILRFLFTSLSDAKILELSEQLSFAVRKSAHFIIYFILGILMCLAVSKSKKFADKILSVKVKYSFLFCVLYAITDEIHQFFVPGRSMRLFDVFVDSTGSIFGILIIFLILKKFKGKK